MLCFTYFSIMKPCLPDEKFAQLNAPPDEVPPRTPPCKHGAVVEEPDAAEIE